MILTHKKIIRLGVILTTLFVFSGCTNVRYKNVQYDKTKKITTVSAIDAAQENKIQALKNAILTLGPNIDPQEAHFVAREGVIYPMVLSNQYGLVSPPLLQNVLVNYGYRKDGLCWQWTRDMGKHLGKKPLKTLDFHHGVAFRRDYWNEHSTLIVTAKGKTVKDGIVLDPWRNSGLLFWSHVKDDKKYPWIKFTD